MPAPVIGTAGRTIQSHGRWTKTNVPPTKRTKPASRSIKTRSVNARNAVRCVYADSAAMLAGGNRRHAAKASTTSTRTWSNSANTQLQQIDRETFHRELLGYAAGRPTKSGQPYSPK